MKTYCVELSRSEIGCGTCSAHGCTKWGNISVTFRDTSAGVCNEKHVLAAAVELVRCSVPRNTKRFRVQVSEVRYDRVETVVSMSEVVSA